MIQEGNDPKDVQGKDHGSQTQGYQGSGTGDVEAAGETTAAATIGGKPDERPVGADTLVKVEGDPDVNQGKGEQP